MRKSLLETTRVVVAVPEAPVFRPTAEEFEDPLAYISSIQAAAASSGIAKIVPPPGQRVTQWRQCFATLAMDLFPACMNV